MRLINGYDIFLVGYLKITFPVKPPLRFFILKGS